MYHLVRDTLSSHVCTEILKIGEWRRSGGKEVKWDKSRRGRGAKTASNEHLLPPRNLSLCSRSLPLLRRSNPTRGSTPTAVRILCQLMCCVILSLSTDEVKHPKTFLYLRPPKSITPTSDEQTIVPTGTPVYTRVTGKSCQQILSFGG